MFAANADAIPPEVATVDFILQRQNIGKAFYGAPVLKAVNFDLYKRGGTRVVRRERSRRA